MWILASVTRSFTRNNEDWFEARALNQMLFSFRAPTKGKIKVGDAIAFSPHLLNQDPSVMVFSHTGAATIHVNEEDFKDLSDRRVLLELVFEKSRTTIRLIATGEVEIAGLQPGGGGISLFDSTERLERYVKSIGQQWLEPSWNSASSPIELRVALLDWFTTHALPRLKEAERKSKDK